MTRHPAHDPDGQEPHQRLDRVQAALTRALDGVLDIEAGLREILILSHHDTAVDGLDGVLDAEAGLAAILPPAAAASPSRGPHDGMRTEALLRTIGPEDRMVLRNESEVRTVSQALARTRRVALALEDNPPYDTYLARTLALDLARAITDDLAHDLVLARGLARDLSITAAGDLDLSRATAVVACLGEACGLGSRADCLVARTSAGDLTSALDLAHLRAAGLVRALDRHRGISLTFRLNVAGDLDLALDIAHGRAIDLVRLLSFEPGTDRSPAHRELVAQVVGIHTAEMCRTIGRVLGRKPPTLDGDSLHALLDDFVTADLRGADLAGIDLTGVHWSELGTRWPAGLDVQALKARSEETFPGSGIWVVRSGTATLHDLADR
ncbi:hypothetical protein [Streptomyces sp. NPDC026589]|uniref:hypothetical protein n=1 Tax=Streptomyces sp. NPDC026589 TaxID=3155609 RepID=UPI0033F60089